MNSNTTLTAAALLICSAATAFGEATLTYALVNDFYGETYAFLELAELPAGTDEIVELTFSELGQQIFGFDRVYPGSFEGHGEFDDDGTGVLQPVDHGVGWGDSDPPIWDFFLLRKTSNSSSAVIETIDMRGSGIGKRRFGEWILVPEPSAGVLAMLAVVGLGAFRRRAHG